VTAPRTSRHKPASSALPDPLDLTGPGDVNLDRHAVIEASAGTGKTYTIEHLVRRLIGKKGVPLDQILLVTFTEKAAGELKDRVRAAVEDAIAAGGAAHEGLLRRALDAFDEAPVFTIHGFCQRVLREYAFENRLPFRLEVVDDSELCARRLREVQRRACHERYGEDLLEILELSNYPGKIDRGGVWVGAAGDPLSDLLPPALRGPTPPAAGA
jgi:ATP-dependent exoDNAse (exonuclease V) beta subunit